MKIIPLSEGSFTIDESKVFIPFDEVNDVFVERKKGSLLVEIQPFVIITSKDIILIDTGLGFVPKDPYGEKNGRLQLHQNLMNVGVNPGEVTKVLLSHLHKDHAGGVRIDDGPGVKKLSLPAATYYVRGEELGLAFEKGFPSYVTDDLECLLDNEQVELLHGDGFIDDYIEYKLSGAHSLYHQVFWIREEDEIIFFGGDEAPQLQQMKHRFVAKYDYDGRKAMQYRQEWWEKGKAEHWTFLFYHDIKTPVFKWE